VQRARQVAQLPLSSVSVADASTFFILRNTLGACTMGVPRVAHRMSTDAVRCAADDIFAQNREAVALLAHGAQVLRARAMAMAMAMAR
jgi:hypothetical protein